MNANYRERFLRSIGIFSESQLEAFRKKKIAVAGLGLGGAILLNLVRLGFEKFHIADPDVYERTNINRQRMAKETTIGIRKDECLVREAREINPDVQLKVFPDGVKLHNVEEFLSGVDWVVDVVDLFAMDDKLELNRVARRRGLPLISCATLGFSGSAVIFDASTPSFEELTGIDMSLPYEENLRRFLQFIAPEIPYYMTGQLFKAMDRSSYIPFVNPGGEIAAAFAATAVAKHFSGLGKNLMAPKGIFVDAMELQIREFLASHKARTVHVDGKKAA